MGADRKTFKTLGGVCWVGGGGPEVLIMLRGGVLEEYGTEDYLKLNVEGTGC